MSVALLVPKKRSQTCSPSYKKGSNGIQVAKRGHCKQNPKEPTANTLSMLLANLAKSPSIERLVSLERAPIPNLLSSSKLAIAQSIEVYNLGSGWNKDADYDYLSYLFSDLAKARFLLFPCPFLF